MSTPTPDQQEESGRRRRLLTLLVASVSSAIAAVVVRKIWGPGTVFGAAATPIIIAFLADALYKPAEKIHNVAVPVLTGSRPSADAPPRRAHGAPRPRDPDGTPQPQTVPVETAVPVPRLGRRGLLAAIGVGLVAFVIGVGLLTGGEIVFGGSAGPSNERRTTILGGRDTSKKKQQKENPGKTTPTVPGQAAPTKTETTTQTTTETTPAPAPPTTTTEPPPADPPVEPAPETPPPSGATGP